MMRIETGWTLMLAGVFCAGTMMAQTAGSGSTAPQTSAGQAGTGSSGTVGAGAATTSGSGASGSGAVGGGTSDSTGDGAAGTYPSDKMFVKMAIMGNHNEIATAQLALEKSQNDQVKQFAQKMIDDHTKMLDDLHALAQQDNIKFEDKPNATGMKLHAKLETLSGPAFDKAYIRGMVKDHKEDVKDFSTEINHGRKQDVKDAASKSLPIIQQHMTMLLDLQKSVSA